jgi:hypothetical protein
VWFKGTLIQIGVLSKGIVHVKRRLCDGDGGAGGVGEEVEWRQAFNNDIFD